MGVGGGGLARRCSCSSTHFIWFHHTLLGGPVVPRHVSAGVVAVAFEIPLGCVSYLLSSPDPVHILPFHRSCPLPGGTAQPQAPPWMRRLSAGSLHHREGHRAMMDAAVPPGADTAMACIMHTRLLTESQGTILRRAVVLFLANALTHWCTWCVADRPLSRAEDP